MVLWVSQDQSWVSHATAIEAAVWWSLSWAGHPRRLLHSHTWSPWPLSPYCTSFTQASSPHLGYSQHGDLAVTFLNWLPSQKIEAAKPITATPRSASALKQHILLDKDIIWPVQNQRVKRYILPLDLDERIKDTSQKSAWNWKYSEHLWKV